MMHWLCGVRRKAYGEEIRNEIVYYMASVRFRKHRAQGDWFKACMVEQ